MKNCRFLTKKRNIVWSHEQDVIFHNIILIIRDYQNVVLRHKRILLIVCLALCIVLYKNPELTNLERHHKKEAILPRLSLL